MTYYCTANCELQYMFTNKFKSHKKFNKQYKENKQRKIKESKYIQYVNSLPILYTWKGWP